MIVKWLRDLNSNATMRVRISIFFIAIVIIMGGVSWFTFLNMKFLNDKYRDNSDNYVVLNSAVNKIKSARKHLDNYIYMQNSTEINVFFSLLDEIEYSIKKFRLVTNSSEEYILIKNIRNKIVYYRTEADETVRASHNLNTGEVVDHMNEIDKVTVYMNEDIQKLMTLLLNHNEKLYSDTKKNSDNLRALTIVTILGTFILGILFSIVVAESITTPLEAFAQSAENISKGEFNVRLDYSKYNEINRLIDVFKKMSNDIRNYIYEISQKANLERRLSEKELENLRVMNLLRESRLKVLQAKINPHFLFNTLNIISRKAVLEGAEQTSELINSLAKLMRYGFSKLDSVVEIRDEVENILEYLALQKARFGNRINVNVNVDKEVLKVRVPCLILQPFVENAFKYGVENMETGGCINITGYKDGNRVRISVADNGMGIKPEILDEIMLDEGLSSNMNDKGTGIRNVRDRLELYFEQRGLLEIRSAPGIGDDGG